MSHVKDRENHRLAPSLGIVYRLSEWHNQRRQTARVEVNVKVIVISVSEVNEHERASDVTRTKTRIKRRADDSSICAREYYATDR
ncbi:hypothetical protein WN55_07077 [Dufourea novaeangliae]|uniref:Uncharacterized protein n=1 Tax=Dufourea novaeangliae TaxID=178035 RepID=A0A154PRW4_DUFNO|nr:hypothetical protein WN55_07077 [Dufourea novaeangliae]